MKQPRAYLKFSEEPKKKLIEGHLQALVELLGLDFGRVEIVVHEGRAVYYEVKIRVKVG